MEDRKLTGNFSLNELTYTSHANLQEKNRQVDESQIGKLIHLANLLEIVRLKLEVPLRVQSGYRCEELNKAVGSSDRSQHLLCEAADFIPIGLEVGTAFRALWKSVKDGSLDVGQLIFETADRAYGQTSWIHVSLGAPWRAPERCNQVLRMQDNKYSLFDGTNV